MITGFQHLHSALRWVVLILLIATIVRAFIGKRGKRSFGGLKKLALLSMVGMHLQLVIGFVLYFAKDWHTVLTNSSLLKHAPTRFFGLEHMAMMLVSIILVTAGYSTAKRMTDSHRQHMRILILFLIALILVLASIPWPFRTDIGSYGWI